MSQAEGLTEQSAREAAEAACKTAGVNEAGAELIRLGSNAVFRLPERIILRIARSKGGFEESQLQVDIARWLEREDYPANRVLDISQPIDALGYPATFWVSVSEKEEYASVAQVALLIRKLHQLPAPENLHLDRKDPFLDIVERLNNAKSLARNDAEFLRERISELAERYDT